MFVGELTFGEVTKYPDGHSVTKKGSLAYKKKEHTWTDKNALLEKWNIRLVQKVWSPKKLH